MCRLPIYLRVSRKTPDGNIVDFAVTGIIDWGVVEATVPVDKKHSRRVAWNKYLKFSSVNILPRGFSRYIRETRAADEM